MTYPVWGMNSGNIFARHAVVSPKGRCIGKSRGDEAGDITVMVELVEDVSNMTMPQKRTAVAVLEQIVAEARGIFLGEQPRGFQPGMVVLISSRDQKHLGVLYELNDKRVAIQTFTSDKPEVIVEFVREEVTILQVPGVDFGIEGLYYAILFFQELVRGMPNDFLQYDPEIKKYAAWHIRDQGALERIVRRNCPSAKVPFGVDEGPADNFENSIEIQCNALRRLESASVIVECINCAQGGQEDNQYLRALLGRMRELLPSISEDALLYAKRKLSWSRGTPNMFCSKDEKDNHYLVSAFVQEVSEHLDSMGKAEV